MWKRVNSLASTLPAAVALLLSLSCFSCSKQPPLYRLEDMFSALTGWVWGAEEEKDAQSAVEEEAKVEHTTHEEDGEWLVITKESQQQKQTPEKEQGNKSGPSIHSYYNTLNVYTVHSMSMVLQCVFSSQTDVTSQESECDRESVASDGSWIITPAPTFRASSNENMTQSGHPLENLLIEHPTMSVYRHVPRTEGGQEDEEMEDERVREEREREELERARAEAREIALVRNRQRYQVAMQLELPLAVGGNRNTHSTTKPSKTDKLRVTRKTAKRQNKTRMARGKQQQFTTTVKKCSFVAGRRRC